MEVTFRTAAGAPSSAAREVDGPTVILPTLGSPEGVVCAMGLDVRTRVVRANLGGGPTLRIKRSAPSDEGTLFQYRADTEADLPHIHRLAARLHKLVGPSAQLAPVALVARPRFIFTLPPGSARDEATRLADVRRAAARLATNGVVLERAFTTHRRIARTGCRSARLTMQEIAMLQEALAAGYYRTPRGCTLADLAERVGLSRSAVWKRLSRVEAQVLGAFAAGTEPPARSPAP